MTQGFGEPCSFAARLPEKRLGVQGSAASPAGRGQSPHEALTHRSHTQLDLSNLPYLVSAALALIVLIDVSTLWLTGKQVPELLSQLVLAVFATYFASGLTRPRPRNGTKSTSTDQPAALPPTETK